MRGAPTGWGCAGLEAVTCAVDGRGAATALQSPPLSALQIDSPDQLVPAVYQAQGIRQRVASPARAVVAAAEAGDPTATTLVDMAATELALLVATFGLNEFGTSPPVPWHWAADCSSDPASSASGSNSSSHGK